MAWFLAKSEPGEYSFSDLQKDQNTLWDGIRNYQARNFLKTMKKGDQVFFYHSGNEKAIVGISEISGSARPDPTSPKDEDWVAVQMKAVRGLKNPVSLFQLKADPAMSGLLLLKNTRLSVVPVTDAEAERIHILAGEKS